MHIHHENAFLELSDITLGGIRASLSSSSSSGDTLGGGTSFNSNVLRKPDDKSKILIKPLFVSATNTVLFGPGDKPLGSESNAFSAIPSVYPAVPDPDSVLTDDALKSHNLIL